MMQKFLLALLLITLNAAADEPPIAYKGRFRPLSAYQKLWTYELAQKENLPELGRSDLWKMHFLGHETYDETHLFSLQHASFKKLLGLNPKIALFSYQTLHEKIYEKEKTRKALLKELIPAFYLKSYEDSANRGKTTKLSLPQLHPDLVVSLKDDSLTLLSLPSGPHWKSFHQGEIIQKNFSAYSPNKEIEEDYLRVTDLMRRWEKIGSFHTNPEMHLKERILKAGYDLPMLPYRFLPGEWVSLKALKLKSGNFTPYSNEQFEKLQSHYLDLEKAYLSGNQPTQELEYQFEQELASAYSEIAGAPFLKANGKGLSYPSVWQLKAEELYYRFPWITLCLALYLLAFILLSFTRIGTPFLFAAFLVHSWILAMRCYILERPPVSNMYETIIYVPWIAVFGSLLLRRKSLRITACLISIALLSLMKVTRMQNGMEQVQAVLDSQYWLTIHVLMVVGSYGFFFLGGVLAHLYLIQSFRYEENSPYLLSLAKSILHSIFIGVALLIPGTILGGVWAAESWGRFWDWDPKESWAFISSCFYLIGIHAYVFRHIGNFGLAVSAIAGLQAIGFTWYGVNYILGTGFHSYGFGSGGEAFYYTTIAAEAAFLGTVLLLKRKKEANQTW